MQKELNINQMQQNWIKYIVVYAGMYFYHRNFYDKFTQKIFFSIIFIAM